jgi:Rad52/22 family double-strand break repair protein
MASQQNRSKHCGAISISATFAPAKPMGANSPISRAGTPSQRPTAFLALMVGAGRRLNPVVSSSGKIVAPSLPSIPPGVRISVQAEGSTIIREGHGSGEGRGASPGEVHDTALKAAETDATKRALATFGRPFGLALYGLGKSPSIQQTMPTPSHQAEPVRHFGFHPDDTTPIPRPSRYYGRRQYAPVMEQLRKNSAGQKQTPLVAPLLPNRLDYSSSSRIDKSQLPIAEPKRLRDKAHLKFVASQPCLICGREPSDPHHLRFAQPRGLGLKVSDEFTVPLCRGHHRQLHQTGNEARWWENLKIDAIEIAKDLWKQTHSKDGQPLAQSTTINSDETMAKH